MFAGVGTGGSRLRDLIKSIRACKTAADERALIAKECASIRTAIRDEEQETRQRNVAKLLFIHMLGYPTHFGQMECLKLIVSPHYSDKRVGYLGLMLLLDERQEVLMLVTNSLKNDLNHANIYVVGLALCALANIASVEIARDTAPEVKKLLENNQNPYVRKKAALCAIRIIRKVPELAENFVGSVRLLLNDRTHGCLTTGVTLAIELCDLDYSNVESFRKLVPGLVKLLKNLVLSGYAPEYDIGGTTDPFLQVKILKLMRILGKGDAEASEQMNDILAQVATNTENLRNVGNSILYECVQTILNIESESGLRVLAVNILGRFLINRDNNIRYVALNTLSQVVASDAQAVQRHRNIIVDCLKDNDVSIRRRALDLVYALVNETNVKMLVRELLNFLLISDIEFKPDLTAKLCLVTEKFAPTKRWHVDTILRIMSIAGQYVPDESCATLTTMIGQSPELQAYAVQKMFLALSRDAQQQPLVQVAAWTVGEYGDLLLNSKDVDLAAEGEEPQHAVSFTEANVLDLIEQVLRMSTTTEITKEYLLTALAKLTERFHGVESERIANMIRQFRAHLNAELQQRACEFDNLLRLSQVKPELRAQLLQKLPPLEGTPDKSSSGSHVSVAASSLAAPSKASAGGGGGIFDIDQILTPVAPAGGAAPSAPKTGGGNILDELFAPIGGGGAGVAAAPAAPAVGAAPKGPVDIMALLTGGAPPMSPSAPAGLPGASATPGLSAIAPMTVYNKNGIMINFELTPKGNQATRILATSSNLNSSAVTAFSFQAAVPRYCKLEFVRPPTGDSMPPMGKVIQEFDITNTLQGQKPILLKMKLDYVVNGTPVAEVTDVSGFPPSL